MSASDRLDRMRQRKQDIFLGPDGRRIDQPPQPQPLVQVPQTQPKQAKQVVAKPKDAKPASVPQPSVQKPAEPRQPKPRKPRTPLADDAKPLVAFVPADLLATMTHDALSHVGGIVAKAYRKERGVRPARKEATVSLQGVDVTGPLLHYAPGDKPLIEFCWAEWRLAGCPAPARRTCANASQKRRKRWKAVVAEPDQPEVSS